MSHPTLVVGLGGTGVLVTRYLKRLYAAMTPEERVPAGFLSFDLDRSALATSDTSSEGLALMDDLTDDEFVYIDPTDIQQVLRNLDRAEGGQPAWRSILEWFPDRETAPIPVSEVEANGASQFRALGRVAFFRNAARIETALRRKLAGLSDEVDDRTLTVQKRVMIVASVAGGTGAGMLLDTAYMARRQDGRPRVFLYLLLPDVFQDVDHGGRIFQNAYASLREIAHLKEQLIPFSAEYSDTLRIDVSRSTEEPFARVFLTRGLHFSGSKAVRDACHLMARGMLPQFHRKMQEKSLALVSNAVSSETVEEQARRRKHCFAAATAAELELRRVHVTPEAIYPVLMEVLRDPTRLAGDVDLATRERLHEIERRLPQGAAAGAAASAPTAEEEWARAERGVQGENDDANTRLAADLARRWHGILAQHARTNAKTVLEDLGKKLEGLDGTLRASHGAALQGVADGLDAVAGLLLADFARDHYERDLDALKKQSPGFMEFEKHLASTLDGLFETVDAVRTADLMQRQRLYGTLQQVESRFPVGLPQKKPDAIQALEARWRELRTGVQLERPRRSWLQMPGLREAENVARLRLCLGVLRAALEDSSRLTSLEAILKVRAYKAWWAAIKERYKTADDALVARREPLRDLPALSAVPELTPAARDRVLAFLLRRLPRILDEGRPAVQAADTPAARQRALLDVIGRQLAEEPDVARVRFEVEEDSASWERSLRRKLVSMRPNIFERRTPNPQRKALCVVMLPEGTHGQSSETLTNKIAANASQILNCVVQVEEYKGSHAWVYFEDLFNPGEHVYNLDEYYRLYQSQRTKELFHIDRRFLREVAFEDIHSGTSRFIITCGNDGCQESISALPRSRRICPKCRKLIRSRCGNEGCGRDMRDDEQTRTSKTCPSCGNVNYAAYWICDKHGKLDELVPVDKERCPACVRRHLSDPVAFPERCVSVRPDVAGARTCPNCERRKREDPRAPAPFAIPPELIEFYEHGVNGHDREPFLQTARRYRLVDDVRCPQCLTTLIPVHQKRPTASRRNACDSTSAVVQETGNPCLLHDRGPERPL